VQILSNSLRSSDITPIPNSPSNTVDLKINTASPNTAVSTNCWQVESAEALVEQATYVDAVDELNFDDAFSSSTKTDSDSPKSLSDSNPIRDDSILQRNYNNTGGTKGPGGPESSLAKLPVQNLSISTPGSMRTPPSPKAPKSARNDSTKLFDNDIAGKRGLPRSSEPGRSNSPSKQLRVTCVLF
jgi:hypothetical protein